MGSRLQEWPSRAEPQEKVAGLKLREETNRYSSGSKQMPERKHSQRYQRCVRGTGARRGSASGNGRGELQSVFICPKFEWLGETDGRKKSFYHLFRPCVQERSFNRHCFASLQRCTLIRLSLSAFDKDTPKKIAETKEPRLST